jgi:hypothetical protein
MKMKSTVRKREWFDGVCPTHEDVMAFDIKIEKTADVVVLQLYRRIRCP